MGKAMKKKYEDRGLEMLSQAGGDPIGRFLIRIMGPGVRREIGRLNDAVSGALGEITDAFLDAESGQQSPKRRSSAKKATVIDAVIIKEEPKR